MCDLDDLLSAGSSHYPDLDDPLLLAYEGLLFNIHQPHTIHPCVSVLRFRPLTSSVSCQLVILLCVSVHPCVNGMVLVLGVVKSWD